MTRTPGEIIDLLVPVYGRPVPQPSRDPLSELILTVLSQNTADTNSGRAFVQMMRRYPSWAAIAAAPLEELVATIQNGGPAPPKAPPLQAIPRAAGERAPDWDRGLPGVGPKTAACVLLFSLGRPALPVDTHVERVSKRLGLIPAKATADQAHDLLEALVPPEEYYTFHMLLIKHGRRTCAARKPACGRCPLVGCPSREV